MTVLRRYFLLQVPGWILVAVILYGLHRWLGLPVWVAGLLLAADVIKDFILYPYLRKAYETDEQSPSDRLVGSVGVVSQPLAPEGYVQVRGELWRARGVLEGAQVPAGRKVRVVAADRLTLVVEPDDARRAESVGGQHVT